MSTELNPNIKGIDPENKIVKTLTELQCTIIEVVAEGFENPTFQDKLENPDTDVKIHFQMPNEYCANIVGRFWDPEFESRLRIEYWVDGHHELMDWAEIGVDYDTLEEALFEMLKEMMGIVDSLQDDNVLEESANGIELYTKDGALKAKALTTKVVSSKTRNKLSDLETKDAVKDLTPSQKKAVKGIVANLVAKGQLGEINKEFNTEPDIVFKANGDAVINPDGDKSAYKLSANEIEKYECRNRKGWSVMERNKRRSLKEASTVSWNNFAPYTQIYDKDDALENACNVYINDMMEALQGVIKDTFVDNPKKGIIDIIDTNCEDVIIEIEFGAANKNGKKVFAFSVEYIGLDPADIYDLEDNTVEDIVSAIRQVSCLDDDEETTDGPATTWVDEPQDEFLSFTDIKEPSRNDELVKDKYVPMLVQQLQDRLEGSGFGVYPDGAVIYIDDEGFGKGQGQTVVVISFGSTVEKTWGFNVEFVGREPDDIYGVGDYSIRDIAEIITNEMLLEGDEA